VPFAALFLLAASRNGYSGRFWSAQWIYVATFLLFFFSMVSVRFTNPSISYAEKFMDHAFLASVMRVPLVPPLDPWFSSGYLNVYYYLGYWMFGALGITSGVPSQISFNLVLPTVFGFSAVLLYALGRMIAPRFPWMVPATLLIVNPSFILQVIQGKAAGSVLWDSTRTITNTINEYPLFSFLWGDVHPHVIGIFNQVLFIFLLVYSLLRFKDLDVWGRALLILICGLSLGSMPPINTWDIIVYAPVTLIFGFMIWRQAKKSPQYTGFWRDLTGYVRRLVNSAKSGLQLRCAQCLGGIGRVPAMILEAHGSFFFLVPVTAVLCYLPFYLQMNTSGILGVGLVHTPTAPVEFLLVHGFFILVMVLYVAHDIRKRPLFLIAPAVVALAGFPAAAIATVPLVYLLAGKRQTPAEILAMLGLAIVIVCEFFYLKDNMGETYYRMNTVFKFYIPAWLLMGASSFSMVSTMAARRVPPGYFPAWSGRLALAVVSVILIVTPLAVPLDPPYTGGTLDGLAYLETAHPGDASAIAFLRSLPGVKGVVEAEGGDYTYFGRVSSFTGIPTIIGWPFHEYMWRTDTNGWYGKRLSDVRTIYEDPEMTRELMKHYNMTHLYVGDLERERYNVRVEEAGLVTVYNQNGVLIYALDG
jgi:YYY domain-containing protein